MHKNSQYFLYFILIGADVEKLNIYLFTYLLVINGQLFSVIIESTHAETPEKTKN